MPSGYHDAVRRNGEAPTKGAGRRRKSIRPTKAVVHPIAPVGQCPRDAFHRIASARAGESIQRLDLATPKRTFAKDGETCLHGLQAVQHPVRKSAAMIGRQRVEIKSRRGAPPLSP